MPLSADHKLLLVLLHAHSGRSAWMSQSGECVLRTLHVCVNGRCCCLPLLQRASTLDTPYTCLPALIGQEFKHSNNVSNPRPHTADMHQAIPLSLGSMACCVLMLPRTCHAYPPSCLPRLRASSTTLLVTPFLPTTAHQKHFCKG